MKGGADELPYYLAEVKKLEEAKGTDMILNNYKRMKSSLILYG